jgi:mRNA-degrading endonuclease RelE of RelBE toxin-antitoxin system
MKYKVITSDNFERQFKRLFKKYRSLKQDLDELKKELLENPELGSISKKEIDELKRESGLLPILRL